MCLSTLVKVDSEIFVDLGVEPPDAFPAGDLGLQKAAASLEQNGEVRWNQKKLEAHAQTWSPWRAYAAQYLWRSLSNK